MQCQEVVKKAAWTGYKLGYKRIRVWDYFHELRDDNDVIIPHSDSSKKVLICKCGMLVDYKKINGTRGLQMHLSRKCSKYKEDIFIPLMEY